MKLKPINHQVVVIVGANSGIGRATALKFAEKGARLVLSGRAQEPLDELAREIGHKSGQAATYPADVTDFEQMKALADFAVQTYGRIDSWVHLAAVTMYAPFEATKPDEFKRLVDVNLVGQAYGAMAALPHLRREGSGALIHVSSIEARRSLPLQSAYAASKHGMAGFLGSLRMELEHEGIPISVVNVMPGSINTPLFNKALTRLGVIPQPLPPVYPPDLVADTILFAAENPARDLYVGGAAKSFALMQRISPRMAEKTVEKLAFRGQKTNWPKPANAPNNLYQHVEGFDHVQGDFGRLTKPSMYTRLQNSPALKWGALMTGVALGALLVTRVMRQRGQDGPVNTLRKRVSNLRLPWQRHASWADRLPWNRPSSWTNRLPWAKRKSWLDRLPIFGR